MKKLLLLLSLILALTLVAGVALAEEEPELLPLYPEGNVPYAYDAENNPTSVTEVEFMGSPMPLPTESYDPYIAAFPVENPIYTVIFYPGSGYFHMNSFALEGVDIAHKMNEEGISCFAVGYRVSPNDYHAILADGQRAVRYVRYHAEEYGVDPNKVAVFGFSAGGHLALMTCEHTEFAVDDPNYVPDEIDALSCMPNACLLGYPVVTMEKGVTFEPGAQVFFNDEDSEEMRALYSGENALPEDMVPMFIWLCADDPLVPNANSLRLAEQCDAAGVPYEMHIFQEGGHGVGLAEGTDCAAWYDLAVKFIQRLGA